MITTANGAVARYFCKRAKTPERCACAPGAFSPDATPIESAQQQRFAARGPHEPRDSTDDDSAQAYAPQAAVPFVPDTFYGPGALRHCLNFGHRRFKSRIAHFRFLTEKGQCLRVCDQVQWIEQRDAITPFL
jgi:hypothetical protein